MEQIFDGKEHKYINRYCSTAKTKQKKHHHHQQQLAGESEKAIKALKKKRSQALLTKRRDFQSHMWQAKHHNITKWFASSPFSVTRGKESANESTTAAVRIVPSKAKKMQQ